MASSRLRRQNVCGCTCNRSPGNVVEDDFMIPDINDINVERIYLRRDFGLRDSWELERIANGRIFQYYTSAQGKRYILTHSDPNDSWTTMVRLRFGQ